MRMRSLLKKKMKVKRREAMETIMIAKIKVTVRRTAGKVMVMQAEQVVERMNQVVGKRVKGTVKVRTKMVVKILGMMVVRMMKSPKTTVSRLCVPHTHHPPAEWSSIR